MDFRNLPPPLSFNISFSDSSCNNTTDVEKEQENIPDRKKDKKPTKEQFKVPLPKYTSHSLFKKRTDERYVRQSILANAILRHREIVASTPKRTVKDNQTINISPIKKLRQCKRNYGETTNIHEDINSPPSKRFNTVSENGTAKKNESPKKSSSTVLAQNLSKQNKENVGLRKTQGIVKNTTHLENMEDMPYDVSYPLSFKNNLQVTQIKEVFDNMLGLSQSVIEISSECSSTTATKISNVLQAEPKTTQVMKKSVCINTTKAKKTPKPARKCTIGIQKNDVRDISTNTTQHNESQSSQSVNMSSVEKERSKLSIGTNTSNKKKPIKQTKLIVENKTKATNSTQASTSVPNDTEVLSNGTNTSNKKKSIRKSKAIEATNSTQESASVLRETVLDNSNTLEPVNRLRVSLRTQNRKDSLQQIQQKKSTKPRKHKIIPTQLRKSTRYKNVGKEEKERLSGFYKMDLEQSQSEIDNGERKRRPPSLFIQSHTIGSGQLKKVLLKRLSTRSTSRSHLEAGGTKVDRKLVKGTKRNKLIESVQDENDPVFKKPLPLRSKRNSANSSAGSTTYREPVCLPAIDTIPENYSSDSSEEDFNQGNKVTVHAVIENCSVKKSTASSSNLKGMSDQNKSKTSSQTPSTNTIVDASSSKLTSNSLPAHNETFTISPMDEALYEIEECTPNKNSSISINQSGNTNNITEHQQPQKTRLQSMSNKATSSKPRQSVTFAEPIIIQNNDQILEHQSSANAVLAVTDRRLTQHSNTNVNFDTSEVGATNNGALTTVINNVPLLLRKWNAEMPDVSQATGSLVQYTLKNIPTVSGTICSGCFVLAPGQKKSKYATMKHSLFFEIKYGEALVNVQGSKFIGKPGFHFIVPLGAIYSITNNSVENKLVLFFIKLGKPTN